MPGPAGGGNTYALYFQSDYATSNYFQSNYWDLLALSGNFPSISPTTSGSGPISSITGCFCWYVADYISTIATGLITYWKDLSGSGNNLIFGGTSGASLPIYISGNSLFNHHNTVRFSGVTNWLTTNSNNASLNFSPSSVTLFTVYSTPIMDTQQSIWSIDNGTDRKSSFVIGLNGIGPDILSPSSWFFAWGKGGIGTNNGWFSITASSVTQGFQVSSPNSLSIRTDRFYPSGQTVFAFNSYGVNIATGVANTQVSTNNFLNIARDNTFGNVFNGDIAEIIGYNHQLTDLEIQSVYNYLYLKYVPSSPSPPPFQPDSLSSLFAWFKSTSIGLKTDGSPVQYWQDDSGSGNNVYVTPANSSSWVFPTLYNKVINGYPVVRFINGSYFSYLNTVTNNNSLNFSPGDLTTFCVFNTNDTTDQQSIYSLDSVLNSGAFVVGINTISNNFFFSYKTTSSVLLEANSPTFGTHLYDAGTFMIRHDRFRQSDGEFLFGRYGADVASGVSSTATSTNNTYQIGISLSRGNAFIGDIAEIISYRRKLSDVEVEQVNTYLLQKYFPSNVRATPLFIYANTPSGIYKDFNLYTAGTNNTGINHIPLYMGSSQLRFSGVMLYTHGGGYPSSNFTLFTQASFQQFPPIILYTYGQNKVGGNIPLYIGSTRFTNNNTSLYVSGSAPINNNNIPLFIENHPASSILTLFTQAAYQQFPPITLYTYSSYTTGNTLGLYTAGRTNPTKTGITTLFIANTVSNPNVSGIYKGINLYLEGGRLSTSMDLYMAGPAIDYHPSAILPLYIGDPNFTGTNHNNISLYIQNSTSITSVGKKMYIKGLGGLAGGLPINASMPLFMGVKPGQINNIPLFISGKDSIDPSVSLVVNGLSLTGNNTTLFINAGNNIQTNNVSYYGDYLSTNFSDIGYSDIYYYSNNVVLNSNFITLFIGSSTGNINNSIPLFHHGF